MNTHPPIIRSLIASTLLLAGCAQPVAAPNAPQATIAATSARSIMSLAGTETVTLKATAPVGSFAVAPLPKGGAYGIEFNRKGDEPKELNAVYFQDGVPFEVRFSAGAAFAVLDADAADGVAAVQLPVGTFDAYVSTKGKPVGSVDVVDPIYFQAANLLSTTAKRDWTRIGLRQSALPASYRRGGYSLKFNPKGLTGFSTRFFATPATAPVPPVPPEVVDLLSPSLVQPGQSGAVQALARDLNGDALSYRWTAAAGQVTGAEALATWKAPRPAGRYAIGLSVEDAYFVTTLAPAILVEVPNVAPVATPILDDLEASSEPVEAGTTHALSTSATDENEDALSWSWSSSGGDLVADGSSTSWTAPAAAGDYHVEATVTDGVHRVTVSRVIRVFVPAANSHANNGVGHGAGDGSTDNRGVGDGVGGGKENNRGNQP